jgi:hypothetical protein
MRDIAAIELKERHRNERGQRLIELSLAGRRRQRL